MKKTMKATWSVLALAILSGSAALAQQPEITSVSVIPTLNLQITPRVRVVGQVKDDLFSGTDKFAQGASDVTEVNLDPSTMGLVGKDKGRDGDMARKMDFMVIHAYKYDKPGMYSMDDVEALRKKLEDGSWSCSIHVRNSSGSTDICSRTGSDHETNEMVILAAQPQKLTFIHMKGKMSLDELNDMSGGVGNVRPRISPPPTPKVRTEPPVPPTPPSPPQPPQ
jgi:hypothetical protein